MAKLPKETLIKAVELADGFYIVDKHGMHASMESLDVTEVPVYSAPAWYLAALANQLYTQVVASDDCWLIIVTGLHCQLLNWCPESESLVREVIKSQHPTRVENEIAAYVEVLSDD